MRTEELIGQLSKESAPRQRPISATTFLATWGAGSAVMVFAAVTAHGMRSDLQETLGQTRFMLEGLLWMGTSLASALVAYRTAVPGLSWRGYQRHALVWLALATAAVLSRVGTENLAGQFFQELGPNRASSCAWAIIGFASFAGYWVGRSLRGMAPTRLRLTGFWIAMAQGSLSAFGTQFACMHDTFAHIFLFHFVPVLVLVKLGASGGSRLLRW